MLDDESNGIIFLCTIMPRDECGSGSDETDYECCKDKNDGRTHGNTRYCICSQPAYKIEIDQLKHTLEKVRCNNRKGNGNEPAEELSRVR